MSKLKHATPKHLDEIYSHFYDCRELFPHIRKDYIARNLEAGNVVYADGIIIIYARYKRKTKLGTATAQAGDIILHQILNPNRGDGTDRAFKVLEGFFSHVNSHVWLTVRSANTRAIKFYKRNKFVKVGTISWMGGELPGTVFKHEFQI